jgi:hypothetical protein
MCWVNLCVKWKLLVSLKFSEKCCLDSSVSGLDTIASTSDIGSKLSGFAGKNICFSKLFVVSCAVIVNCNFITPSRHVSVNMILKQNTSLKLWYFQFYILIRVKQFNYIFLNISEIIYFKPQNNHLLHNTSPTLSY